MKPSSAKREIISHKSARNAAMVNQLATPGIGSLIAGRWLAGSGQLILALVGFIFIFIWFFKQMAQFYGQINGDVPVHPVGWIGLVGFILFALAWFWSLITSLNLLKHAGKKEVPQIKTPPVLK
jgi:hypothetical protein